jgi:hypothetical protein
MPYLANRVIVAKQACTGLKSAMLFVLLTLAIMLAPGDADAGKRRCKGQLRGAVVDNCSATAKAPPVNTEKSTVADKPGLPFRISVDGEAVDGAGIPADSQRKTDVGLDAVDIQVKFDGLDTRQILSVKSDRAKDKSGVVTFQAATNYAAFVSRGEIRIFKDGEKAGDDPVKTLALDADGKAVWKPKKKSLREYSYVLRVYNDGGAYDETKPQTFGKHAQKVDVLDVANGGAPGDLTEDLTDKRDIPVYGGAVTVSGRNVPPGDEVRVMGWKVPADTENKFLFQQILPPGDHDIDIAVSGGKSDGLQFTRQINIPKNDWFYVGLADLTVGRRFGDYVENADPGEFERTYTKGRLAFYLKGKIKGKYLLTAAADTREGPVKDLFKNAGNKDPRQLLRRLDPDDYYPIYGDDSTIVEDAPTSGKVFVRLDRGQSHIMWGNFKTTISGTEFARNERGLYGAHALYKSEALTSFGESKTKAEVFAAQSATLPQRDDFLGTGGSAYFLKRQDVTTGSERVAIERRDALTGAVVSRTQLTEGKDYTIDYFQGVIILTEPVNGTANSGSPVSGGSAGDDQLHVVVEYEATPAVGKEIGQSYGGRAEQWVGDHVRIGATALSETVSSQRNGKTEADVLLRKSDKTGVEFEVAQSEGRGVGQSFSTDGGLTFRDETVVGAKGKKARAYRVKAKADLGELSGGRLAGDADAYYEYRQAGFSALDSETTTDKKIFGASLTFKMTEEMRLRFAAEGTDSGPTDRKYRARAEIETEIAQDWSLIAGVTWTKFEEPAKLHDNGERIDVGGRLTYSVDDNTDIYVFGQATVSKKGDRLRNNRIGAGVETQLTERLNAGGEISYGTTGIGGAASLTYKKNADSDYYLGYRLDPDRDAYPETSTTLIGTDKGVLIAGANIRLNKWTTAFTESNADLFGKSRKLSQIYGLTFTPDDIWSASLGLAFGTVKDPYASDFDRKAFTARLGYNTDEVKVSLNGEVRLEDSSDNLRDRTTWLAQADASVKTSANWRMLGHLDAVISQSDQSDILDGKYIEASIGAAFRPIENDRLNLLFKYTYLYDLPGAQQVNVDGNILGPAQKSHILSVDATYDLNEWLTVGAKYGYRMGEVSTTRNANDFESSSAHLGILRADVALVKNWDLLLEGRVLHAVEAKQTQYGFLAAAYRHIGENMKIGVGYNFGSFSDNVADLTHDDGGVFLNVVGKF